MPLELNLLFISSWTQFRWFGLFQNIRTSPQFQNFIVYIHAMILSWFPFMRHEHVGRAAESVFGPPPPPASKGGLATNLYTKSERLTTTCRVNRAWSETVNLYNIWHITCYIFGMYTIMSLGFFIDLILPTSIWPSGRLSVTETSTRGISWGIKAAGV
jgi:hypothetical protein